MSYPLSPPASCPSRMNRCENRKMTNTGSTMRIAARMAYGLRMGMPVAAEKLRALAPLTRDVRPTGRL